MKSKNHKTNRIVIRWFIECKNERFRFRTKEKAIQSGKQFIIIDSNVRLIQVFRSFSLINYDGGVEIREIDWTVLLQN